MIGAMVHAPHEPPPVTAGPELFETLGGSATVGMIVDGLYDRLERDRELSRLFRSPRQGDLLDHGAQVDVFCAAFLGDLDMLRGYIAAGLANAQSPHEDFQETPLTMACRADKGEHPETVKALLELGADPNAPNARGRTALSIARSARFSDTVALLLVAGAR